MSSVIPSLKQAYPALRLESSAPVITVTARMRNGQTGFPETFLIADFGELAVTVALISELNPYVLTHKRTGMTVCTGADIEDICEIAQRLSGLDWQFDTAVKIAGHPALPIIRQWQQEGIERQECQS